MNHIEISQSRTFPPKNMGKLKLRCGVYGEGRVFSVEIKRSADVEAFQKAIVKEKKDINGRLKVDPAKLTLYLAGKKDGEEIKWLKDDDSLDALLQGGVHKQYMKMYSSWLLEAYFGENFQPGR